MFDIATYNPHKSLWTKISISIINLVRSECWQCWSGVSEDWSLAHYVSLLSSL